jgi:hypothetical protein
MLLSGRLPVDQEHRDENQIGMEVKRNKYHGGTPIGVSPKE